MKWSDTWKSDLNGKKFKSWPISRKKENVTENFHALEQSNHKITGNIKDCNIWEKYIKHFLRI